MPPISNSPSNITGPIRARVSKHSRLNWTGLFLAAFLPGTLTAQDVRFDAGRFTRETIASHLEEHIDQRLRFGFYEEALAAALETAAAFDGQLSPGDQARLDETVARCLLINRADLEQAATRFGSAYRLREESTSHAPADTELSSLQDNLPSRQRLRGWEAECHLLLGDTDSARELLAPLAGETDRMLGNDLAAALVKYASEHARPWNERDNASIRALNDRLRLWSWIATTFNQATGDARSFFESNANRKAMEEIIASPFVSIEYQGSLEDDHYVGPHPLSHFLNAAADYLTGIQDDARSVEMAKRLLGALENDQLDLFNLQRARLLEIVLSRQTTPAPSFEEAMLDLLGRPSRLESEGVYRLALAAARHRGSDRFFRDVVLMGKLKNARHFTRQKEILSGTDPGKGLAFEKAYQEWIESRIQLGVTHPKTIERWDAATEMLDWGTGGDPESAGAKAPKLDPETVAIEWVRVPGGSAETAAGDTYTALVMDHRGEALTIDLGDADSVDALAGSFDGLMSSLGSVKAHETAKRQAIGAEIEAALATLRRRLVEPILSASPSAKQADRWLIGYDGRLGLIPFFALGDSASGVLGMEKTLIHVNSVASWIGTPARLNTRGVKALLVGDPNYGASDSISSPRPSARTVNAALAPSLAGPIKRLEGTGNEARALEKLLGASGHRSTLLLEADASEERVRAQLPTSSLLHIATHGFFFPPDQPGYRSGITSPESLFFSAIILGGAEVAAQAALQGKQTESKNDGLLMAAEFYPLDLRHVDLVSLSACQTALGEPHPGEGIAGLSRGLAAAGARNSLLTLWSISDAFTPVVMTRFLERSLSGMDLHQAINETQRELFAEEAASSSLAMATYLIAAFRIESNTLVEPPSGTAPPVTTIAPPAPMPSVATGSKWIIACQAEQEKPTAEAHARRWRDRGLSADVLWIPDYASLSGAKLWLTYVGPFDYPGGRAEAQRTLSESVAPLYSDAFGVRLDQGTRRETLAVSAPATSTPAIADGLAGSNWVIACEAEKERSAAENHAATWKKRGLPAGVLWIPDFASLSGAKLWLTYVGPWPYQNGRDTLLDTLREKVIPHHPDAFGIRIDQNAKRETIR
jgi:CHAT domain-containing protein